MTSEPQEIVSGKSLAAKSSEVDFAMVLSRVIASIENDPAQLRSAVYELARIKLQTELSCDRESPARDDIQYRAPGQHDERAGHMDHPQYIIRFQSRTVGRRL